MKMKRVSGREGCCSNKSRNSMRSASRQILMTFSSFLPSSTVNSSGCTSYAVYVNHRRNNPFGLLFTCLLIPLLITVLICPVSQALEEEMVAPQEFKIFTMTYNVNGKYPYQDMRQALKLVNTTDLPDFYVFALQEAPITLSNAVVEDTWSGFFRNTLSQYDYIKVNEVKMQAIQLIVFLKRSLLTKVRDVEINWTRMGFGGWWGNKGGVSIRMTINGCHVCFLSCHFAAHDHNLDQRISDYKHVVYGQRFERSRAKTILSHDHVLIMGDLNFRINDLSADEIYSRIVDGSDRSLDLLLNKDQLNTIRRELKAFVEFDEQTPRFWPTYKFKIGSTIYDLSKRKPAFTDRILFKRLAKEMVTQEEYRSHPEFVMSDHKPVSSIFYLKLYQQRPHRIHSRDVRDSLVPEEEETDENITVTLRPVSDWNNEEDNEIRFSYHDDKASSNEELASRLNRDWDWIAIMPANFDALDQWITYAWVSTADPETRTAAEGGEVAANTEFSLRISSFLTPGESYRLVYFNGEDTRGVLGISQPFVVLAAP